MKEAKEKFVSRMFSVETMVFLIMLLYLLMATKIKRQVMERFAFLLVN